MDDGAIVAIVLISVIGLPWLILHYIIRWKTAATLTTGDEALLEDLYQLARRLDGRMETVERLVAADHPEFKPARTLDASAEANPQLAEINRMLAASGRTIK